MTDLERLLELVRSELKADDARLELGGRDPAGDDVIWCRTREGHRVVVTFDGERPELEATREKLESLVAAFGETLEAAVETTLAPSDPQHALDESLDVLAAQTRALAALVVDASSPMVWGSSLKPRGPEDVLDAFDFQRIHASALEAELELVPLLAGGEVPETLPDDVAEYLVRVRALPELAHRDEAEWSTRGHALEAGATVRHALEGDPANTRMVDHGECPFLARNFAGPYWLILVFAVDDFSELHAEAAAIHATPWLTRLVEALPPIQPGGGGKVISLRRLRPV